jgi:hypothetical protein
VETRRDGAATEPRFERARTTQGYQILNVDDGSLIEHHSYTRQYIIVKEKRTQPLRHDVVTNAVQL